MIHENLSIKLMNVSVSLGSEEAEKLLIVIVKIRRGVSNEPKIRFLLKHRRKRNSLTKN